MTHRLETSLEKRPVYRVIMSAVIILITGINIITASSTIISLHFHHVILRLLQDITPSSCSTTHTHTHIDTHTTMAQLFSLYIQSPNPDYSFILSPFSLHHSTTSTSRAVHQFSHTVTLFLTHVSLTLYTQSPDCTSNKDILNMPSYDSRTFPPRQIDDGQLHHQTCIPTPLEHSLTHASNISTFIY